MSDDSNQNNSLKKIDDALKNINRQKDKSGQGQSERTPVSQYIEETYSNLRGKFSDFAKDNKKKIIVSLIALTTLCGGPFAVKKYLEHKEQEKVRLSNKAAIKAAEDKRAADEAAKKKARADSIADVKAKKRKALKDTLKKPSYDLIEKRKIAMQTISQNKEYILSKVEELQGQIDGLLEQIIEQDNADQDLVNFVLEHNIAFDLGQYSIDQDPDGRAKLTISRKVIKTNDTLSSYIKSSLFTPKSGSNLEQIAKDLESIYSKKTRHNKAGVKLGDSPEELEHFTEQKIIIDPNNDKIYIYTEYDKDEPIQKPPKVGEGEKTTILYLTPEDFRLG